MKRFYQTATVVPAERGFMVQLDGRPIKTPEKRPNLSPTKVLAEAICMEWNAQADKVDPASMPMAKLQNTALDRVAGRTDDLICELVRYAGTDLLCYRAASPQDLAQHQDRLWQPLLDWTQQHHDMTLTVTTGILHVQQEMQQLAKLEYFLAGLDSFRLAAFYTIATLCGSVVIALNMLGGNISAQQAWDAAQLDENYQTAQWGRDEEAQIRQNNMKKELDSAARFLEML